LDNIIFLLIPFLIVFVPVLAVLLGIIIFHISLAIVIVGMIIHVHIIFAILPESFLLVGHAISREKIFH
jgi:hypothetical protein